ncbi:Bifunctional lycopene cyclase/phytoene synthase like protein [Verticillium longisporum]|uniref:Bifunctional lycopene cyclase/phytoene synthase n=1 Tax=Verticillium longisporum TaxID=100787 RepID=A0A0G4MA58_VERLO|nr:Bifunctional lycopene cyclase/phytoene synthase like protein [Verticillium longisporum]KAG7134265.1 Bifunctional lycopene cyclase/phytoene synthase like protein [Verticillium longisporum]CRK30795.1 hypothetical protein BN1708_005237 [Verticillium longisporum]
MGYDYALVHLFWTVPPATILTILVYPFLTRVDAAKLCFIITVAVVATIPWDSYLIRTNIWNYPPDAVLGYSLFDIPAEELFFFVIQTYFTAQLYVLFNKPVLHAQYLNAPWAVPAGIRRAKVAGQVFLAAAIVYGCYLISGSAEGTYLGLILTWAAPFALLTWSITAHFILALPWTSTLLPIVAPTVYLWVVDELALGRGTWAIQSGTKLGVRLFGHLEIEEAVFFLVTNMLVVFGLAAFDKAVAVVDAHPDVFAEPSDTLSMSLIKARFWPSKHYDMHRITAIRQAASRLAKKSRSFSLASSAFPGRLRIDMTLLYSYCRLADDLVDDAADNVVASDWIDKLQKHLDLSYAEVNKTKPSSGKESMSSREYADSTFPSSALETLRHLPVHLIPKRPFDDLLKGFVMDMDFDQGADQFPITNVANLELYASYVASTVGLMCLELVFHHCIPGFPTHLYDTDAMAETDATKLGLPRNKVSSTGVVLQRHSTKGATTRNQLRLAACRMGLALQYVNIARDIAVDARIGRVYLPTTWLQEAGLTHQDVLRIPRSDGVMQVRKRLLDLAFDLYDESRAVMVEIPPAARAPMIVAVESYMEIGRVLRDGAAAAKEPQEAERGVNGGGRATVPKGRRIWVAWSTLMMS